MIKVSKRDNLDRYYLLKLFGFGIFLHRIHHDEHKDFFHSHPWDGISFILGSYIEEYTDGSKRIRRFFNLIKANRFHRVELKKPVWTLFIHSRRYNLWSVVDWSVVDRSGRIISQEPWRGIGGRTSYKPA